MRQRYKIIFGHFSTLEVATQLLILAVGRRLRLSAQVLLIRLLLQDFTPASKERKGDKISIDRQDYRGGSHSLLEPEAKARDWASASQFELEIHTFDSNLL